MRLKEEARARRGGSAHKAEAPGEDELQLLTAGGRSSAQHTASSPASHAN